VTNERTERDGERNVEIVAEKRDGVTNERTERDCERNVETVAEKRDGATNERTEERDGESNVENQQAVAEERVVEEGDQEELKTFDIKQPHNRNTMTYRSYVQSWSVHPPYQQSPRTLGKNSILV